MGFRALWKVWMTVGGGGCSASTWLTSFLQCLHTAWEGTKAQCHGNHIKKHLNTDLLTKAMKIVLIFSSFFFLFPFALGVCFNDPMSISVRIFARLKKRKPNKKKTQNNQVRMITSHILKAIHSVCLCLWCVFSVSMALSYSILYTRVTMYHVLRHSQGPTLSCQLGVTCETRACPRGAALDARRSRSVSACCDSGLRPRFFFFFFFYSCSCAAEEGGFGPASHCCSRFFLFHFFF